MLLMVTASNGFLVTLAPVAVNFLRPPAEPPAACTLPVMAPPVTWPRSMSDSPAMSSLPSLFTVAVMSALAPSPATENLALPVKPGLDEVSTTRWLSATLSVMPP